MDFTPLALLPFLLNSFILAVTFMRITLLDLKPEDPVYDEPSWFHCNNFLGTCKFLILPGYDRKGRRVMAAWDIGGIEAVFNQPR